MNTVVFKGTNTLIQSLMKKWKEAMEYRKLLKDKQYREIWSRASSNEYGRLFQGVIKDKDGTQYIKDINTCHWIQKL